MWWRSHALSAVLCAGLVGFALSGCGFQPLYGGSTVGGARLKDVMASVDVVPIPGRVGQKLRNELIFENTGGGNPLPTRYRLEIAIKESVTDQLVQITGDATGQVYQLDATFKLIDAASGRLLFQGQSISRAPYSEIERFHRRMGWRFNWVSSNANSFNHDFRVSFTPEEIATGRIDYNFGGSPHRNDELPGVSVFMKDEAGAVFHIYSTYGRGVEVMMGTYRMLDFGN